MDPAVREIAQTRLFAERALYVTQKMPMVLRWQTELLSVNAVEMPAMQQLVTNSTEIAASVERFAHVAEQLPSQLSTEREAILQALQAQENNLTPLVNEVRQTLTAGTQMSTSLNTTLTTFDTVMKRFGVGDTNTAGKPTTNAEPFRIQDYGQTAVQFEGAARQLTELLDTLDRTIGSTNLATFRPSRPDGSAGADRRQGDRELRFLKRHPASGHRAGSRPHLPLSQRPPDAMTSLKIKPTMTKPIRPFSFPLVTRHSPVVPHPGPRITVHCLLTIGRWDGRLTPCAPPLA